MKEQAVSLKDLQKAYGEACEARHAEYDRAQAVARAAAKVASEEAFAATFDRSFSEVADQAWAAWQAVALAEAES